MAIRRVMISDITGAEAEESQFTTLIIREHPAIEEPEALDVLPAEVEKIKVAPDLVTPEVGENGDRKTLVVTLVEFPSSSPMKSSRLAGPLDGRRSGWSSKQP
jgi:hypothetical protein